MKKKRQIKKTNFKIIEKPIKNFGLTSSRLYIACSDSFWHSGIHFDINEEIKNVYDGRIVACRYSSGYRTKDINFDTFNIPEDLLEKQYQLYPGNFFIYNFFDYEDGKYKLKDEYKSENEKNKTIRELIKHELSYGYSNSFILIEHNAEKSIVLKNNTSKKINYQFYTLYNHLRPLNNYLNKEKKDLFFYNIELKINNIFPFSFVKGYSQIHELKQNLDDFIQIPSETLLEEVDFYKYSLNNEIRNSFVDESFVRSFTSHSETRRPAFTDNEKNNSNYLSSGNYKTVFNELFLFDNINKSNRCVKAIITEKDNINIEYDDFINYLNNTDENIGLQISTLDGFIYFSKTIKDTLKECLIECNEWDLKHNKPKITYNTTKGFLLTDRYIPSGQKEYHYLQQNNITYIPHVETYYIPANKLKSNTEIDLEPIYIPCELKIEKNECTSTSFKKVAFSINNIRTKCFISMNSFRNCNNQFETKRKLRPYESLGDRKSSDFISRSSRDVISNILIYNSEKISNRNVVAEIPSTTAFKVNKDIFDKFLSDLAEEKYDNGIYVEYEANNIKNSGYVYLPWGYDLSNIDGLVDSNLVKLKEKISNTSRRITEWFNQFNQQESISFDEFQITLKRDEKIIEDQIYVAEANDSICNLSRGDIIGHGGYLAETPDETKEIREFEDYFHFETFCKNIDFMDFNNNRTDYKADFLIKKETSVHKKNPITETIIKPLSIIQFNHSLKESLENENSNNASNSLRNIGKRLISNSLFKPKFAQVLELSNEALESCYFSLTGTQVSLINSDTFIEIEYRGNLIKLEDDEYISKLSFSYTWDDPYYISKEEKNINVFKKTGATFEDTGKSIKLYNTYKYEWKSQTGDTYRQIKYYFIPAGKKETFYINQKILSDIMEQFSLVGTNDFYKIKEGKKLLQSEIFEEPKNLIWGESAEALQSGTYENTHETITDKDNKTWILGKEANSTNAIWINKEDIDDTIDTEKPVEEIIYDKWKDFFEELKLTSYGKYRCEDEEKLVSDLNLTNEDGLELKYLLNHNQETVSGLYFTKESEWDSSTGLFAEQKKEWQFSDQDFLQQQHDDFCFWDKTGLPKNVTFFHPVKFLSLMEKVITPAEFNPYENLAFNAIVNKYYTTWKKMDNSSFDLTEKVISNPGFAPYSSSLYGEYKIGGGYAPVNTLFLEKMAYANPPYPHEGIDFDGENIPLSNKDKKARTPIISFINGTVILLKDHKDNNFGKHIIISDGKNKLYLLGHLYDYADGITENSVIMTGMTIGYVGNTGNCGSATEKEQGKGSHLHISIFEFQDNFAKEILTYDKTEKKEEIINKIGGTDSKGNPSYYCHNYPEKLYQVIGPLNNTESRN